MFLNSLNPKEKDNFLKLAVAVIKADGVIEVSETQILSAYAGEMQVPVCNTDDPVDVDAIISEFASNSTVQVKRIVLAELLALVFVDGEYSDEEKAFVQKLTSAFEFNVDMIDHVVDLEKSYMASYTALVDFINKE